MGKKNIFQQGMEKSIESSLADVVIDVKEDLTTTKDIVNEVKNIPESKNKIAINDITQELAVTTQQNPFEMVLVNDKEEKKNLNIYLKMSTINKFKDICKKSGMSQSAFAEYIFEVAFENIKIKKSKRS